MSWLSTLIYGKDPGQTDTDKSFQSSIGSAGTAAQGAQSRYAADSSNFNPEQAYQTYAKGAFGDFSKNLALQLRDVKGQSVGAGRFDSGLLDEDQGQVIRDASSDFSNKLAQGALTASGQREAQIGQEGNYALGQSGMYNDLLAGQLDREQAKQNAKQQQRSDFWGSLIKGGAMVAAFA